MVRRPATFAVALCIGSPTVSAQEIPQDGPASFAVAVAQTVDSLAGEEIWPGFDARRVPLAIYDGINTYLFRHPTPPDGFVMLDSGGVFVYAGRHETMRANTHTMLGDVSTATVLSQRGSEREARAHGGVAIHEAFHVFQRQRYPDWSANGSPQAHCPVSDNITAWFGRYSALGRPSASAGLVVLLRSVGGHRVTWPPEPARPILEMQPAGAVR